MTIYVDELTAWDYRGRHTGCRLFTNPFVEDEESARELHAVAEKIGLSKEYFLNGCYPLIKQRRVMALSLGAIDLTADSIFRIVRKDDADGG
jgi:hypothetical protein